MVSKRQLFALAKALEGVPVLGALGGSPAARAGIRYGDVLLSVNGIRTRSIVDYLQAKAQRSNGMEIVVFRGGSERTSELTYTSDGGTPEISAILAELVTLRVGEVDEDEGEEINDPS
jgi:S1-C subfamily serine protease